MTKTIDYYYTHLSPWTYLGHERFLSVATALRATVKFKPSSFAAIFPKSGGLPLAKRAPQRKAYRMMELRRWREFLGIPLNLEPKYFPVPDEAAQCLAIAAAHQELDVGKLSGAMLRAVWAEERDVSDESTLIEIAKEQDIDGESLLERSKADDISAVYEANTRDAMDRHVFGAPTYIFQDELFWGQDRLEFLERALTRA
jgi:2-hydroxychromene-2-carboxylate isomerase